MKRWMYTLGFCCSMGLFGSVALLGTGCGPMDGDFGESNSLESGDVGDELVGEAEQALSVYESEPNNTAQSAKLILPRDDNFGRFLGGDTVDYWKFNVPARTYVNIFLGNIPAGSDYDVQVFSSTNLGSPVWSGVNGGNTDEMIVSKDLSAGDYIVKIFPFSGPRGDVYYKLRYSSTAVSRGWQWVDAQVPYCGGVNGGNDILCGGICTRTGSASNPLWDPYRSDCSGFVSWAWQLAAPGLTTAQLSGVSSTIIGSTLAPGDILLGNGHVVLFESWTDKAGGQARILHEPSCGGVAKAEIVTLTTNATNSTVKMWGLNYTSYRRNMP